MLMLLATRHIAILLFEGFSLLGADIVAEAFNAANEFAAIANLNWTYEIFFLSAAGGNVTCSSSIRVWTDRLDAPHFLGFDALFVAGGRGVRIAARDERLIAWLSRVHENTGTVRPIGEGRSVLDAACISGHAQQLEFGSYHIRDERDEYNGIEANDRLESMKSALVTGELPMFDFSCRRGSGRRHERTQFPASLQVGSGRHAF